MKLGSEDILELTSLMYSAALDGQRWHQFVKRLHQVSGGVRAHIFGADYQTENYFGIITGGHDPEAVKQFESYYGELNAWMPRFSSGSTGEVMHSQEMCSLEEIEKTEFYHDWVRPNDDIVGGGGAVLFNDQSRGLFIGGNIRRKDIPALEDRWIDLIRLLTPNLQQAFEISRTLEGMSIENLTLLDEAGPKVSIFILDGQGVIRYASKIAEQLLSRGEILGIDIRSRLRFINAGATLRLQAAIEAVSRGQSVLSNAFSVTAEPISYHCRVTRFFPDGLSSSPFGRVYDVDQLCLMVTLKPVLQTTDHVEVLRRELSLSLREAQVSIALTKGLALDEIADNHQVSIHTVRNQIKSAMSKLNVRRQTDLVRTILSVLNV